MDKFRCFCAHTITTVTVIAGAMVAIQIIGWLGEMLIWPIAWLISCTGYVGDIFPKTPEQQLLVRFAIGISIVGTLIGKISFSQRKKRG